MTKKIRTLGEFHALLAPLTQSRRHAIYYTLDTRGTLDQTLLLRWKEGLHAATNHFARNLVRTQPRHIHLDYVFWEFLECGQPAPLFGLEDSVGDVTAGGGFAALQAVYDGLMVADGSRVKRAARGATRRD